MLSPLNRRSFARYVTFFTASSLLLPRFGSSLIPAAAATTRPTGANSRSIAQPQRSQHLRPRHLGTTFSQLQCSYLGLDYRQVFAEICQLGLDRIRLCAYWNELQPHQDQWNFSTLDWLLDCCYQHNIEVVLAIGMKVPRWPEFHFPHWVSDRYDTGAGNEPLDRRSPAVADLTLNFVQTVVDRLRFMPAIRYWQVENEPFTQLEIAGGRFLSPEFVWQEVELVRSRLWQSQKILLTNAIHLPQPKLEEDEPAFQASTISADAVGFNVYTKVPNGSSGTYLEPLESFWQRLEQWQKILKTYQIEPWIAEAQAEPWEPQKLVAVDRAEYPSATPRRMRSLVRQLSAIGYDTVLLWGCEYWYWQRTQRRNLWWHTVEKLIHS